MNTKVTRSLGKLKLTIRKNIPTITTIVGVAGVVGTGILSARGAYKSVKAVDEHKKRMEQLRANKDSFDSLKEYNKEVVSVYTETGKEMAKSYWPAALAGAVTVASVITTHKVHRKRYLAMTGLYMASLQAFNEYRRRVEDKYGVEAERDLYFGRTTEEVVTVETDKKGKEKTSVEIVKKSDPKRDPTFSTLLIDINDKAWYYGRPESTYYFLVNAQRFLNEKLQAKGYLFLNDVLTALEKPEIPEGQFIGWIYDPDRGEKNDNCIDFGLMENSPFFDKENVELFLNGKNEYVYITLNHDGTMFDRITEFNRYRDRNGVRITGR